MNKEPPKPFLIRNLTDADLPAVSSLLSDLSSFFPDDIVPLIEFSLKEHMAIVGLLGEEVIGFLVYEIRDRTTGEILWMGVKEEYHGLGLGTMMLQHVESLLEKEGVSKIVTSTLSYTVPYKPFEKVRSFFYKRGFKPLGIQSDFYDEGADRLILVKRIEEGGDPASP